MTTPASWHRPSGSGRRLAKRPVLRGRSRQLLGAAFLVAVLVVLAVVTAGEHLPALSVYSSGSTGGKALRLWLDDLGFATSTLEDRPYRVPADTGAVLVLDPSEPFVGSELRELAAWVRGGGRLVLAADALNADPLFRPFGFTLDALPTISETALPRPGAPLDPFIGEVQVQSSTALRSTQPGQVDLLGDGERVFAAWRSVGQGQVYAVSAPLALSNSALRRTDNARLALSLVGRPSATVVFDERHHGFGSAEQRDLSSLLTARAWGQALVLGGVLCFLFVAAHGRRFGRPRSVLMSRGRSLSEYVASLAGLYNAGGKRAFATEHFRRRFRRELAAQLSLPGDATNGQIAARARVLGCDPGPALRLLEQLDRDAALGERELLRLVREGESIVSQAGGARQPRVEKM